MKGSKHGVLQQKNWIKRPYFHRAVEMKQPHTMTEPIKTYAACLLGNTSLYHEENVLLTRYPYWSVEEMSSALYMKTIQKL